MAGNHPDLQMLEANKRHVKVFFGPGQRTPHEWKAFLLAGARGINRDLGTHLENPLKETIRDVLLRGHSNSFPESQQVFPSEMGFSVFEGTLLFVFSPFILFLEKKLQGSQGPCILRHATDPSSHGLPAHRDFSLPLGCPCSDPLKVKNLWVSRRFTTKPT